MRKFKRVAILFLVFALIVQTIPVSAYAESSPSDSSVQIGKYFKANDENGTLGREPSISGNTEKSYEDGKVKVNKTITGTDNENQFKVKLSVKTTEKLDESISSPDVATVIVIDTSGSMAKCVHNADPGSWGHKDCKSKMTLAKNAAQQFINNYVDKSGESDRKVAIVKFSGYVGRTDVHGAQTVQGWTDASQLDTSSSTTHCTSIGELTAIGGTNIEAGMLIARNLITQKITNSDGEEITNKNVILFSDGEPTYGVSDSEVRDHGNSTTVICENSSDDDTDGDGLNVSHNTHKDIAGIVSSIKDVAVPYAIYVGDAKVDCSSCTVDMDVDEWLSDCGFTAYQTTEADKITNIFQTILNLIELRAQAWEATDPMGDAVDFEKFDSSANPVGEFVFEDNKIKWDLKGAVPEGKDTVNGVTVYTYELEYTVTLDTLAEDFEEGKYYATNGVTEVSYLITEKKNDDIDYKDGTAYFNVPSVMGYKGSLEFTKVDSLSGKALEGAKFTLTTEDKEGWSMTVTSDKDGKVKFEGIPSGHVYTLEETSVPAGYYGVEGTVVVNYGEVSTNLNIVDGKLADPNKTTDISGEKNMG